MRSTPFRPEALDSHRSQQLGDISPVLSLLTALSVFIALAVVLFGSALMDVRANCVTSGAITDTNERSLSPNLATGQQRLIRKAGNA